MNYVLCVGGKQYCVSQGTPFWVSDVVGRPGDVVTVVCLSRWDKERKTVSFSKADLQVRILDIRKGPKVVGFTYKPKNNEKTKFGHRSSQALVSVVA